MHSHCCVRPSKYAPVTHVIFDLDGTILDSEIIYAKALRQAVEDYGCEYYDSFIFKVQGSVQKDVALISIDTFNLDTTVEDFLEKFNGYANVYLADVELMPGAERLIRHLMKNNIPIAVATSSNEDSFQLKTQKHAELFSCFHHIVCGGTDPEVAKGKPEPDIFLVAASRFDTPPDPSKCLVFEDSKNGVLAGLAAGMQVVMLPDKEVSYEVWKLATLRLDSFNYMMPELFGLPSFPEEDMSPEFAAIKVTYEPIQDNTLPESGEIAVNGNEEPLEFGTEETLEFGTEETPEFEIDETPDTGNEQTPETENEETPQTENQETLETQNDETPETE